MNRIEFGAMAALVVLLILSSFALAANPVSADDGKPERGMTIMEFRAFASSLSKLPGRIWAIELLRGERGDVPDTIGILTRSDKGGWQLVAFARRTDGKFSLAWRSGKLDDTFSVASPDDMTFFNLGSEEALLFHGCAPHTCPDVFSYLLYVPSKNAAFTAHYFRGMVTYSSELDTPGNKLYRDALKQEITWQCQSGCQ